MKTRNYVLLAFLLAFGASANGQMLADYQFSTGHDPSLWYTLDSTRNLLVDGSVYYRRSYIENIGFDFPFADTSYSQFSVTLAGVLRLGGTRALTTSGYQGSPFHPSNLNKNLPKIVFFGCSGYVSDSAYVHFQTFGTAPDRVLVVEYALQTYSSSTRQALFRYQLHLYENGDIEIVYPSRRPPLTPGQTRQQGIAASETDLWIVDDNHTATHYTSGQSATLIAGYWPDTNRYYRFDYPVNVCPTPQNLVSTGIDTSSVTLSWNNPAYTSTFVVEYATTTFAPGTGAGTMLTVNDTFATVTGLQAGTQYYFYVRSVCDIGDTSNAAFITASTLTAAPVSDFPYFCDFESADEREAWFTPGATQVPHWWFGTAANNTQPGLYGLYISKDSGATNTGGDDWIGAYAYRDFNLTAGDWQVNFDWRAYGDWRTNGGTTSYYHFLRAFLAPSSATIYSSTPPNFPSSPHSTAVPAGWIDLNPQGVPFYGQTTWTSHSTVVTVPTSGCYHLVFYWETDGYDASTDLPAAIDNISLERIVCPQPQQLTATATEDEMLLSWHRGGSESLWVVRYGNVEAYVQDTFYLASDLDFNTEYIFEVAAVCGEGDTSLVTTGIFNTLAGGPVTTLPYFCDFEDSLASRQWILNGTGQTNRWYVGTAANNTPQGQHALYVSQDGGASNTYSGAAFNVSYAYRTIVLDAAHYACTFDWRCQGDDDFHFLRAFIVPANALPQAGSYPINNNHYSSVPTGWIDLNQQNHYMSGESNWTTHLGTFEVTDSGLYALMFMWENDDYTPQNPPAAVDNISIEPIYCPIPTGLDADPMQTMIDLTWVAGDDAQVWLVEYADTAVVTYIPSYTATGLTPNTEYVFSVKKLCYTGDTSLPATITVRTACLPITTLPYTYGFEDCAEGIGSGEEFVPCWNRLRNYSSFYPQVSSNGPGGGKSLYWNLTAGLLDDVIITLPELDESINATYTELRFKAVKIDYFNMMDDPVFVIGVMSDPTNESSFEAVDTVTVTGTGSYSSFSVPLLAYSGTGRFVAIRGIVNGDSYASAMSYLDDVELHELDYCHQPGALSFEPGIDTIAVNWTPGSNETQWTLAYGDTSVTTLQPNYVVRNLVADSEYLFSVIAVCGEDNVSEATMGSCRTLPRPLDPPDTNDIVVCPTVTGLYYTQEVPWADHAYEFTFHWNDSADVYEIHIENLNTPGLVFNATTTSTSYFFDATGHSGEWIAAVRAVCNDSVWGEWSDTVMFTTPLCIGIDAMTEDARVTIYPNPANGPATLTLNSISGTAEVSVVDLNGRTVMTRTIEGNTATSTLPLKGLAAGTYFVRVSAQGLNTVRKLIVK